MSNYGRHGQTGGGGVRPRQNNPPRAAQHGSGDRDRSQPDQTVAQLWPGYLDGGYFDAEGNLKIEYVSRCIPGDEVLEPSRQKGVEALARAMTKARPALTSGQLRRFFTHCRVLEAKLKSGITWAKLRPKFVLIDSVAAESFRKEKIPGLYYDFIRANVAAVTTEDAFLFGFMPHFEALVGFATLHLDQR